MPHRDEELASTADICTEIHRKEEADHEAWVSNLSLVLQQAEREFKMVAQLHGCSTKQVREAWIAILGYIYEFETYYFTQKWLGWDTLPSFQSPFQYILCNINRVAHMVDDATGATAFTGGSKVSKDSILCAVLGICAGQVWFDSKLHDNGAGNMTVSWISSFVMRPHVVRLAQYGGGQGRCGDSRGFQPGNQGHPQPQQ